MSASFHGGFPCEEPMSFLELAGCRDVVVLEMVRPDEVGRARSGPLRRLDQRASETVPRLIDQGVFSLMNLKDTPRVLRLAPSKPLDFMMLSFRARDILAALDQGRSDAKAFLSRPLNYLQA